MPMLDAAPTNAIGRFISSSSLPRVFVLHREPFAPGTVGTSPELACEFVVGALALDHVVRPHQPSFDFFAPAGEREAFELKGEIAARLLFETPGRHDSRREARVERHVLPPALHAVVVEIGDAPEVGCSGTGGGLHHFLEEETDHRALRDQPTGDNRCSLRSRAETHDDVPDAGTTREIFGFWPGLLHALDGGPRTAALAGLLEQRRCGKGGRKEDCHFHGCLLSARGRDPFSPCDAVNRKNST